MTTIINFFGGPGVGKSIAALDTTSCLRKSGVTAELVTEVGKDLTWEQRQKTLSIQPYVTVKQYRNIHRVVGQVDYIVTDGPVLMGYVYAKAYAPHLTQAYYDLLLDFHNETASTNIFLEREFGYQSHGRNQNEYQARLFDGKILEMLAEYGVPYITLKPSQVIGWAQKFSESRKVS